MHFNEDLSTIHAYLCADGYVIKNPETQKHKYYYIGFRNQNTVLLKDFQRRFKKIFGIKPYICKDGRCRIQSKEIFEKLTKNFIYYSSGWKMPFLSKENLKLWLRAFFDCEAWVEVQKTKSRAIRLECVNKKGLEQIKNALEVFGIFSSIKEKKGRKIWRLNICGKDDLQKFKKSIGFLHPNKSKRVIEALESYSK